MSNLKELLENSLTNRSSINKEEVDSLILQAEDFIAITPIQDAQKELLAKMKIELHSRAHEYIEEEVKKYRESLYKIAKEIAQTELETDIITKAHASRAREMVWRKKTKFDFSDGFLSFGGLFLGAGLPHILDLQQKVPPPEANTILIILCIIGALALGMGIVFKAKA